MQRTLWIAFLMSLGWALLGLAIGVPLYLIKTPCLAQSSPQVQFGGQLSTLQDLSLLRLLTLLDNRNISTTSPTQIASREIINGHDFTSNIRKRLIILTVLVIVLGVLPMLWKLHKEFNKLIRYRTYWLINKCGGLDLAWLSIKSTPGFRGWGENRLKEFLHKNGLGQTLITNGNIVKQEDFQNGLHSTRAVEVTGLFTVV